MLFGATLGFIGVAVAAVFQCVAARSGFFDGGVVALTCVVALGACARSWQRKQPVKFRLASDGLTTWDRTGMAQNRRISGCAQWSDRLLALTLLSADGRASHLLVAADAVERGVFRELAVRARRGAQAYL
ncbi:lipoprotein [Caballeronia humi]|uniref:Lipoprotein n=2 Tax=Caballeronia humi TaxID=326474 RepID=A0A158GUY0_9BURK|nr:lipoprotein [Caballeronia humi]